jgi:succinoglycan biosynthesis protein ExoA
MLFLADALRQQFGRILGVLATREHAPDRWVAWPNDCLRDAIGGGHALFRAIGVRSFPERAHLHGVERRFRIRRIADDRDLNRGDSRSDQIDRLGRRMRQIDNPALDERTPVDDSYLDGLVIAEIANAHTGLKGQGAMGCDHRFHVVDFAIRGGSSVVGMAVPARLAPFRRSNRRCDRRHGPRARFRYRTRHRYFRLLAAARDDGDRRERANQRTVHRLITILTSLLTLSDISVSIVIACRNENPRIRQLLGSLIHLDRSNLDLEAIVADGMSTDGTRQILEEFARANSWFAVIENRKQIASAGLNVAILRARGEFIVRMDGHTVYEPDYVVRCLAVVMATRASNVGGPQRSRAEGVWARAIHAGFHSPFATGGAHFRDDDYRGPADTVPYGCWRRDFLIGIGLFDETLARNQDDELNMRIRLAGGVVWQDPSIVSWYSPRSTLGGLFRQYLQFGFWRVAVLRKHPRAASWRQFVPGAAVLIGLVLVLLLAVGVPAATPVLLILAAVYMLMSLHFGVRSARREGWDLLPVLPVTFAVYQGGYAAGFSIGLVYWGLCRERPRKVPRMFTGLTR